MLDVKPFRQSLNLCGPAALKMVLDFYGLEKSEEELARLTRASLEHGTSGENLIAAARQLGFGGRDERPR